MSNTATEEQKADTATPAKRIIEVRGLYKDYRGEARPVQVLDNLDLDVDSGTIVSVEGASGVGKSTLLNIIGTIDSPTSGSVLVDGHEVATMTERDKEDFRANSLGFIFQHHYLLPDFTVVENVMMPMLIQRVATRTARREAEEALRMVGLGHRFEHYPTQISGGELARGGVARALVGGKKLILADEPTGNLDRANSDMLADLLWKLQSELNFTLMIVTHDQDLAKRVPIRYRLRDHKLEPFQER